MGLTMSERGMKVAILAGGLGTRLAEETEVRPKPMVEIGGRPILWHIMKQYAHYGYGDFVIALGYKGEVIKRWMVDYSALTGDLTVDLRERRIEVAEDREIDDWSVTLVDTGVDTQTGGRIKRIGNQLGGGTFMLTWGDGVSDVNIDELVAFHRSHGKLATVTAVRPPARFGHLELEGDRITEFSEKPQLGEGWINGAFFVLGSAMGARGGGRSALLVVNWVLGASPGWISPMRTDQAVMMDRDSGAHGAASHSSHASWPARVRRLRQFRMTKLTGRVWTTVRPALARAVMV